MQGKTVLLLPICMRLYCPAVVVEGLLSCLPHGLPQRRHCLALAERCEVAPNCLLM